MPEILYNQESRVHWGLIIRLRTPMHIGLYTKVYWTDTHTHSHTRARSCMDGHAFANVSKNTANNNNHFCIIILSEPAIYIIILSSMRTFLPPRFFLLSMNLFGVLRLTLCRPLCLLWRLHSTPDPLKLADRWIRLQFKLKYACCLFYDAEQRLQ